MDTFDFDKIFKSDKLAAPKFQGAMALDTFCVRFSRDGLYIINTAPSSSTGEHWLLLRKHAVDVDFFDSYGRNYKNFKEIASLLDEYNFKVISNGQQLQGFTSSVCGDYCVIIGMMLLRGISLHNSVKIVMGIEDVEERDHIARRFLIDRYDLDVFTDDYDRVLSGKDNVHVSSFWF